MGEALFRYRLAVIIAFFGVAVALAIFLHRHPHDDVTVLASLSTLVGVKTAFLASGLASLLGFALRASGEARLGSAVYGQRASTRVITGGPFRVMRHPLYVGTWLFFVAAAGPYLPPLVLALLAALFAASLASIARFEESALAKELGDAWTRYANAVPRFLGVPKAVDDDGVTLTATAVLLATLGNLGLLSTGLYRVAVAAGVEHRALGVVNLVCLAVWVVAVVVRRMLTR